MSLLRHHQLLMSAGTPPGGDPYWSNVIALLHFDTGYSDETGRTWNINDSPSISSIEYKFGGGSILTTTGHMTSTAPPGDFFFSAGTDLTIELWVRLNAMPTGTFYSPMGSFNSNNGWCFFVHPTGRLQFHVDNAFIVSGAGVFGAGAWTHIAITRQGTTYRLFRNGQIVASGTISGTVQGLPKIGRNYVPSDYWPGYIDDVRITKGVARYTADFTPPVEPFPNYGS